MMRVAARELGRRAAMLAILAICQGAHLLASLWMLLAVIGGHERAWKIAVGYDQLANVATGGSVDETISSRASRARKEGRRWGCVLCRVLDFFQKDHCSKSEGS